MWSQTFGIAVRRSSRRAVTLSIAALIALTVIPSHAQMRLDVSGVGASQYPIALGAFQVSGPLPQDIVAVIRSDLTRSGAFRVIDPRMTIADSASIDYAAIRSLGADAVVGGSVVKLADGRYDIRYRVNDVVRQTMLGGEAITAPEADLRYAAHRAADNILEKLTGERGVFSTRIAFVTKQGARYRLNIADWDGENVQTSLSSPEPIISPSWSPTGDRLAYVSFESRKPVVYVHALATGKRTAVANFKGSNSAPAWSPDGKFLAVALTRDGLSQIYLIPSDGSGAPRRLISSSGIDTEPNFAPDGKHLYFSSDRGGTPQIYRLATDNGEVARVTFSGSYNVSPRVSPDGKRLAFLKRRDGRFFIALKNLEDGAETVLSEGGEEESPSFAPSGRWVMYATRSGGRDILVASSIDGRVKQRLTSSSVDIREPTWGPFPK
ncbi:MAG: Tol-Pal system protein TolB [Burkholderiaceae bacterium]|nr:Tol-Pal system protein TolB [Burkholderiaceae bacterium]